MMIEYLTVVNFNGREVEVLVDNETGKRFIKPGDVLIKPRMRKEVKDIDKMSASLHENGQFNPIMLDEDGALVQGFRRLTGAMGLGWSWVWFATREDLSLRRKKVFELEENIQRQQMTPFEEAEAISEIHLLMEEEAKGRGEEWRKEDTAAYIGKSRQTVYNAIKVTEAAVDTPEIKEATTVVGALQIVDRNRKIRKRQAEVEHKSRGLLPSRHAEILVGDSGFLITQEPDEKYDCIATNFPFGVDLHYQGVPKTELYEDEETMITDLIRGMCPDLFRVLKEDSWLVGFFDVRKITYSNHVRRLVDLTKELLYDLHQAGRLHDISERMELVLREINLELARSIGLAGWLEEAGFSYVQVVPCVWVKPNKTQGNIGHPDRGMVVAYEAFIFAAKGNPPLLKRGRQNIFIFDTDSASDRVHSVQMSVEVCREVLGMITLAGTHVLDTFAGSGAFGLASLDMQCDFTGYELDPKKAEGGNMRLREHLFSGVQQMDLTEEVVDG
jgi:ParB/RepB/Spo0J family partition protein